ncbi:hypothetical protein ACFQX7_40620 [Luedemannella flava]
MWLLPAVVLVASRAALTWFAAPAHLVVTLGGWLLFALVARWLVRGRDPFHLWAAIGGVALLRTALLLVALAARGPGRYWLNSGPRPPRARSTSRWRSRRSAGCSWSSASCCGAATGSAAGAPPARSCWRWACRSAYSRGWSRRSGWSAP